MLFFFNIFMFFIDPLFLTSLPAILCHFGPLGPPLALLGVILVEFWRPHGLPWGHLGSPEAPPDPQLSHLAPLWGRLGDLLGLSWPPIGVP